jgi:hypothetical protein
MEEINEQLLQKFKERKILIKYMKSTNKEDLIKLRSILKKAFPIDASIPEGNAKYYEASLSGMSWTGTDTFDEENDTIVPLDDFFKPSEVNINYEIF